MDDIKSGDVIFSCYDQKIVAGSIAQSGCYDSPKPVEFGSGSCLGGLRNQCQQRQSQK